MIKVNSLENNLREGYKFASESINNLKEINFDGKSKEFELGVSFYVLFNFRKVKNYRKIMKGKLNYNN